MFLDEIDLSTMQREITACGGNSSLNKPCLYDYIATGDEQFALATLQTDLSNQEDVITLGMLCLLARGVCFKYNKTQSLHWKYKPSFLY